MDRLADLLEPAFQTTAHSLRQNELISAIPPSSQSSRESSTHLFVLVSAFHAKQADGQQSRLSIREQAGNGDPFGLLGPVRTMTALRSIPATICYDFISRWR